MREYENDGVQSLRLRRHFDMQNRDPLVEALNNLAEIEKSQIAEIVRKEIKREPEKS